MWKYRSFLFCTCLTLIALQSFAQEPVAPPTMPPASEKAYVIPKLELAGVASAVYYIPYLRRLGNARLLPGWTSATIEVGKGRNSCQFQMGFRRLLLEQAYDTYVFREDFFGLRLTGAYRRYLSKVAAEGLYLQPTLGFEYQEMSLRDRETDYAATSIQYRFSARVGYQLRLLRSLVLDAAVGPGLGVRRYPFETGFVRNGFGYTMPSVYNPAVYITDWGYPIANQLDGFIDASLALGWKF